VVRPAYQRELISHLWNLGEIEDYDNPIIEYRIKYDELNKTNNELNKTNNELNKTNNEINKTNNELNKTYNQLINSRSWRLTQPLRSLKGMLKGVKKY
jgi:peptidoglycan hydrolase CwlO-like protein